MAYILVFKDGLYRLTCYKDNLFFCCLRGEVKSSGRCRSMENCVAEQSTWAAETSRTSC